MKIIETAIKDLYIIEPAVFEDARGYFFESWNQAKMEEAGLHYNFIQDNQSQSVYGTIRGRHFQTGEFSQAKLVRAIEGTVLDVAVDLRQGSPTFGRHVAVELSADNKRQLMIPRHFAHGFSVLTPSATFAYKCDNIYCKVAEAGIRFDDPAIGIDWKIDPARAVLSDKDKVLPLLKELSCF